MSVAAAAAKLNGLVRGSLVGIQVTKRGVSPRIITADVVGTRGRSSVTGGDLQQRFGLRSTWARFTLITTYAGTGTKAVRVPSAARDPGVPQITAETAAAMSLYVHQLFTNPIPILYGRIFPTRRGAAVVVQKLGAGGRWSEVRTVQPKADGGYSVSVLGPGTYRVLYGGLAGPSVNAA
jgi:stage II sporulation protein D